MELETRIAKLEAIEAIRRLKAQYAEVCDTGYDPERMRPFFTDDAVWASDRFGTHRGFDEIYAFFAGVSSQISWALHYMVAPVIEVDDDLVHARGTWYLWQPCTVEGEAVWLTGTYADRYRNEDGVWRFEEVRLAVQTVSPYEDGWVRRPFRGE